MSEEFIASTLANIGVPAVLCFYVLFALNKTVDKLSSKIDQFSDRVNLLIDSVKSLEHDLRALNHR